MDKLKVARKSNRRLFTKACNEYKQKETELTSDEKIVHLRLIEEKAKIMLESEYAVRQEQFVTVTTAKEEEGIEKEIDESETYIDKWRILEQELLKLTRLEDENSVISESPQNKLLHYPKIELPVFDGNIKNWLGFWGQFQKIDRDSHLDKHDKFAYLSQAMEKGSTADELIKSFPPGAESYDKALTQLQSRFGRDDLLIEVYVRDLLSLVLRKNSDRKCTLRKLYDSLESKLRALEVLGVARDKYAAMLYPLVESALPDETLRVWERFRAQHRRNKSSVAESENPTVSGNGTSSLHRTDLDNLLLFLLDEIEGEERVGIASQCFHAGIQNRQSKVTRANLKREQSLNRSTAATLIAAPNEAQGICIFCSGVHKSNDCFKARKMQAKDRQAAAVKARCCFLCLKKGHVVAKCRMKAGCLLCGKRHHLLLCRSLSKQHEDVSIEENGEISVKQDEALANFSRSPEVILQTLVVTLRGCNKKRSARAIVDTASQRSYILKSTAEAMGYECIKREKLRHSLFGGDTTDVLNHEVFTIALSKIDGSYNCHFEVLGQKMICNSIPPIRQGEWMKELEIFNIHIHDRKAGPIEILIGADVAGKLMTGGYKLLKSGLAAIETKLGWTVMGKNHVAEAHESTALFTTTLLTKDAVISDLWALDSLGILDASEKKTKEELHRAAKEHFLSTVMVDRDGRFVVHLPWLEDHPPLPDNFKLALKRLDSTVKKLRSEDLYVAYEDVLKEWEREGIVERVPRSEIEESCHYLPHRHVVKENSTTKIRPVFDASAKLKASPSLNDCLEKGINLIELIPSILTRFRMRKIGVTADIRKAFLQVGLNPKDKNYLRFLWYDEKGHLMHFRHNRVVFGVTCSPFLLGSVIQYHIQSTLNKALNKNSKYPADMVKKLLNSFYVDNCLTSVKDELELENFIRVATDIMAERKFDLRGWEYSDKTCTSLEPTCILGMLWDRSSDTLSLSVPKTEDLSLGKITKRMILAAAHKIFDPLGIACPVTLLPKFLLQRLWKSKVSWDEDVDSETKSEFLKWMKNLHYIRDIKIPRWLRCDFGAESLHFFCDASKFAYSAAAFIRIYTSEGFIQVHLLRAKARITPCGKKETTMSRLELLAATIAARLASDVVEEFKTRNVYFWTDSSTVLSWIKREEPWGLFVQNRVQEIRSLTTTYTWRHIPGSLNPADLPSRGCTARQLLKNKWWEGPSWLYLKPEDWPESEFSINEEEILKERKKSVVSSMVNLQSVDSFVGQYFSSYSKTIRMVGWMLRFLNNSLCKYKKLKGDLTSDEYKRAEISVFKLIQKEKLHESKLLRKMQTFKDQDGLLRVTTKLFDCGESAEFQNPILLPSSHNLVLKLVTEEHRKSLHAGLSTLLARLREKYWIVGARKLAKQIISKCVICRRHSAKPLEVPFAPLPKDRVTPGKVFEVTGVDYAGPLYLRSREKAWVVVFTCAVYRAVHFELVKSLTTEAFIQALRRFIARRGRISVVYSDNGTNFTGTKNALKSIDWNSICSFSTAQQITWKFIPPTAAWWGGWWERMVRMLKELLRRVLGKAIVDYQELLTVLCDCEAVINSRPLTYISDSPEELKPLTPAMFLVNDNCTKFENPDLDAVDRNFLTKRSRYLQKLREDLRCRFRNEYLALLIHRGSRRNNCLEIGDIVLIGNDTTKRNDWSLGLVLEIYPGRDGISRVARLQTYHGERLRPFQRLYPLEISACGKNSLQLPPSMRKRSADNDASLSVPSGKLSTKFKRIDTSDSDSKFLIKTTRAGRVVKVPERLGF